MANKERICTLCGKKVSACHNSLRLQPRVSTEDWKRAAGLEEHIGNIKRQKAVENIMSSRHMRPEGV